LAFRLAFNALEVIDMDNHIVGLRSDGMKDRTDGVSATVDPIAIARGMSYDDLPNS
jgi:hypothetical protein